MRAARLIIPSRTAAAIVAMAVGVVGCAKQRQAPSPGADVEARAETGVERTTSPVIRETERPPVAESPIHEEPLRVAPAKLVPVKTGTTPLVYLVETPQVVQVVDETSGLILAEWPARGRTILRVDDLHGVVVGKDQIHAGPLPKGRRYGIYVVPDSENVTRSGQFIPRPSGTVSEPAPAVRD